MSCIVCMETNAISKRPRAGAAGRAREVQVPDEGADSSPVRVAVRHRSGRRRHGQRLGGAAEIDCDGEIGVVSEGGCNRQRIYERTVEQVRAPCLKGVNTRGSRSRRGCVEQSSFAQPDFFAGLEIGRHRSERNRQILDGAIADQLAAPHDALALDEPVAAECRIEQAQHMNALESQHPFGIGRELAGGKIPPTSAPIDEPAIERMS